MRYELDILAALMNMPKPTTQEIVTATNISERKVQNVLKTLQSDLCMKITRIKDGRKVYFVIDKWGVFESGEQLKNLLAKRKLGKVSNKSRVIKTLADKSSFYESVKMVNYIESTRLEGLSVSPHDMLKDTHSIAVVKRNLIAKYSKYKGLNKSHG